MEPILYKDIIIESILKFGKIERLFIEHKVNEHAKAYFTVILCEDSKFDDIFNLNFNSNIKIKAKQGSTEITLFNGIPVDVKIKCLSNIYYLDVELKSYSYKLDIKKISRSFQDKTNPYNSIFTQIVNSEYSGTVFDIASNGKTQNSSIIQYEETDWTFLKRLASQLKAIIHPFVEESKPQIFIGVPTGNTYLDDTLQFKLSKEIDTYMKYQLNYGGWTELDLTTYEVESYENYNLCDKVTYNDSTFAVAEKKTEIRDGVIINLYKFQLESGLKQNIFYNQRFTGLSIDGKVIAVEKDCLKLHLSIDESQDVGKAYWYQLNTPYTTEGTTGFYSMLQIGDSVKLFSPKANETLAFVRNINRTDGGSNPKTQDPNIKYYQTIHGKEMKLAPEALHFTAKESKVHIHMTDTSGIDIKSNHPIKMSSDGDISISGNKISIKAADRIVFVSKGSNIIVDKINHFKAEAGVSV